MADLESLTNDEILAKLREYNLPVVPVSDATRKVLIGRLRKAGASASPAPPPSQPKRETKSPARSPARTVKRKPAKVEDDEEDFLSKTLTDPEIEQTFQELGWAKPKITDKNRSVLQKKINHARARSRSSSQSRIVSSTRFEDEDGENDDSMDVEEEEENHVEIPVRRASRSQSREMLAPSPKKMKKTTTETIEVQPTKVGDSYQFRTPTVTVVVNPPVEHVQPPVEQNPQPYVPQYTAPKPSQPFVPTSTLNDKDISPAKDLSPATSVFVRGQDVSAPTFNGRASLGSGFTSSAGRYSSPLSESSRTSTYRSTITSQAPYLSESSRTSTYRSTITSPSSQAVTKPVESPAESLYKPKVVSATQTNIKDEDSAYIADLRARLFGTGATPTRAGAETTPFSKQFSTPYNAPEKIERKTTPIAPRIVSTVTPARRTYFEEQSSDPEEAQTPPPTRLNATFNSPAVYRFSTPGRTSLSQYIPSFFRSAKKSVEPPVDGSSSDEEDEEPKPKKLAVSRPVAKSESQPVEPEVSLGVLWAKYLPHLCVGFFAVILYVYWQLRNAESKIGAGESQSIVLTIAVNVFWNVLLILLLGIGVWLVLKLRSYYVTRKEEEEAEVVEMVKRVISRLVEHAEACKRDGHPENSYLPKIHIRDELIPVDQKRKRSSLWKKVVAFVEENESRIRKETKECQGEMYEVWRWLPTVHPGLEKREKGWQGSAFNVDEAAVNTPPVKSPTPCLKIRHMFDPSKEDPSSDWQKRVADDLLEKCEDAKIVHLALEPASKDGVVYMKCSSKDDAKKVYKSVHGWWYGGKILVVKYVTVQRYHERFPMAASSKDAMRSSQSARVRRFQYSNSELED